MAAIGSSGLYEDAGGKDGCRRLSEVFYARAARDPVLAPFFPGSLRCAVEGLTAYLVQFLGGPCEYSDRRWSLSLREAHQRFKIGERERESWLRVMDQALEELRFAAPLRQALNDFFDQYSRYLIDAPAVPDNNPTKSGEVHQEVNRRWHVEYTVEQAVRAARGGDSNLAIRLAESTELAAHFERDCGAFLSLLALMSGGKDTMVQYVQQRILDKPELALARYIYGRTLLHHAAAEGSLPVVSLLLRLKADPNAIDHYGHSPLYFAANQCAKESGAGIVRLLVIAGGDVNVIDRAKRCTPLHMAARRGYGQIAEALLDCGAALEARDSLGDTPLRRAVNCSQPEVARLLLTRGADSRSVGNKGLTPREAARGRAMKQLFELSPQGSSLPFRTPPAGFVS